MANHKSAEKRHRQSLKRRDRNRNAKSTIRTAIKKVHQALEAGDATAARELAVKAERLAAKAAAKGILHKRNAARRVGRLTSMVTGESASA